MAERDGESFFSRWARRKIEVRTGEPEAPELPVARRAVADDQAAGDAGTAAPIGEAKSSQAGSSGSDAADSQRMLTDEDFADVDFAALDATSDYSRFMGANVPDAIRRKALARLWTSDPLFAGADPIHDYHGDFTDAAVAVTDGLKTAYRVGKGFLTDEEVAAWDRLGKPEAVAEMETAQVAPDVAGQQVGALPGTPDRATSDAKAARSPDTAQPPEAMTEDVADGCADTKPITGSETGGAA